MSLLDSTAAGLVLPEVVGPLIIQPLRNRSTAMQVCTQVETASPKFRLPVVDLDAASTWLAEGADITETDPTIGEEVVTAMKLGALTKVSNELANDSSPAATQVVGDGLTRSIARQLDVCFFGTGGGLAPPGLLSLRASPPSTCPVPPGQTLISSPKRNPRWNVSGPPAPRCVPRLRRCGCCRRSNRSPGPR